MLILQHSELQEMWKTDKSGQEDNCQDVQNNISSCWSQQEGADNVVGIINIEGMDDGNIPVNADDDNHEDGRGLEDMLEWIKSASSLKEKSRRTMASSMM